MRKHREGTPWRIPCNLGCAGNRIGINRPIRCTVNPAVTQGDYYKKQRISRPCNVVVIGGGTAGLEAACTAAEVGCTTFLIEKKPYLGGLAVEIAKIPNKKRLGDFPAYMIRRAEKLGNLFVFKGTEACGEFVKNLKPQIIVNATGSVPLLPPIPGLEENLAREDGKVYSILDMIKNINNYPADMTGMNVVVIGGGAVGLDVVEYFAPRGAKVTIVEMLPAIGSGIDPVSRTDVFGLMDQYKVRQMPGTKLNEVRSDSFLVSSPEGEEILKFDYGFVCLGMKSASPVIPEIQKAFQDDDHVEIINVGDSVRARRIIEGTDEGRNILCTLEKRGYL